MHFRKTIDKAMYSDQEYSSVFLNRTKQECL